jgi:hypothetical protein
MYLLQPLQNHMSKGNKGNQPERTFAAEAKHARSDISLYAE